MQKLFIMLLGAAGLSPVLMVDAYAAGRQISQAQLEAKLNAIKEDNYILEAMFAMGRPSLSQDKDGNPQTYPNILYDANNADIKRLTKEDFDILMNVTTEAGRYLEKPADKQDAGHRAAVQQNLRDVKDELNRYEGLKNLFRAQNLKNAMVALRTTMSNEEINKHRAGGDGYDKGNDEEKENRKQDAEGKYGKSIKAIDDFMDVTTTFEGMFEEKNIDFPKISDKAKGALDKFFMLPEMAGEKGDKADLQVQIAGQLKEGLDFLKDKHNFEEFGGEAIQKIGEDVHIQFRDIFQLMRDFFVAKNKDGNSSPIIGSKAVAKAKALMDYLYKLKDNKDLLKFKKDMKHENRNLAAETRILEMRAYNCTQDLKRIETFLNVKGRQGIKDYLMTKGVSGLSWSGSESDGTVQGKDKYAGLEKAEKHLFESCNKRKQEMLAAIKFYANGQAITYPDPDNTNPKLKVKRGWAKPHGPTLDAIRMLEMEMTAFGDGAGGEVTKVPESVRLTIAHLKTMLNDANKTKKVPSAVEVHFKTFLEKSNMMDILDRVKNDKEKTDKSLDGVRAEWSQYEALIKELKDKFGDEMKKKAEALLEKMKVEEKKEEAKK